MKKVTYILSNIHKALAFEWIVEELDKTKYELSFILLNPENTPLEEFLRANNVPTTRIVYRGKKDFWRAFWVVRKAIKKYKSEVVHCHLFDANLIGLFAAKTLGVKQRIYTRHHSTLHHLYFPRAVYYDRFINYLATHIVAISEVVQNVLKDKEFLAPAKIKLIHHGFRLKDFENIPQSRLQLLESKYPRPILGSQKVKRIGIIARQTEWKGIQYIIPAFAKLLQTYPHLQLLLANAQGDYKSEISALLATLPPNTYLEIPFEADIASLYKLLDYYVHTPITEDVEAFGQTYIEALASGIPSVFTLSGIAREFIRDGQNALVVPFKDSEAIYIALKKLLENDALSQQIALQGAKDVALDFALHKMIVALEDLYVG